MNISRPTSIFRNTAIGFMLLLLVFLLGTDSPRVHAQALQSPVTGYYVRLTYQPITTDEQSARAKRAVVPHVVYWNGIYESGKVQLFGSIRDGGHTVGMAILKGVTQAEAQTIANNDPAAQQGVLTVEVLPLSQFLPKP